ncbi:hypothetical protein Gotri_015790, partial [Gossypium trilobum]|nr:hypothetical protein [Gossypium trilobum]
AEDRILQCHIRNLPSPLSLLIEPYLREADFWHVALVGRGCKLDSKLVNALVNRLRGRDPRLTHSIFHAGSSPGLFSLVIGEAYVVNFWVQFRRRFMEVGSKWLGYKELSRCWMRIRLKSKENDTLGRTSFRLSGRSERTQLRVCHVGYIVAKDVSVDLSHVGLSTELQDIRLLLDQRSEAEFEWTLYEDLAIPEVIHEKFFVNSNIWHVKVSLVVYATVEIHETDRVLRQFRF